MKPASIYIVIFLLVGACTGEQKEPGTATVTDDSAFVKQRNSILSKRFGDPNSPYRNEDSFIVLLQSQLQSPWYSNLEKSVFQNRLQLVMQNRVGSQANDFTYITPAGVKKKLYDIKVNYLLLYFYNPECHACKETKSAIQASTIINSKINSGDLTLLAIYPDTSESIWRKHLPEMPKEWLHGRDENEYLHRNKIYDLRAIPTVYLLGSSKKVLLKDCMDIREIENVLGKWQAARGR